MNKHTASFAGRTFKRNSKGRVYTHTVLGFRPLAADLKERTGRAAVDFKYSQEQAAGKGHYALKVDPSPWTAAELQDLRVKELAEGKAAVEAGWDAFLADYLGQYHFRQPDLTAEEAAAGGYWVNLGWCSRAELADKLANTTANVRYYARRVVVEAVLKV